MASPIAVVRWYVRGFDLLLLGVVPAVLAFVYMLPDPQRGSLALDYGAPTLVTMYTSHFVHLSSTHLLTNILAFLMVAGAAYLLSVACGRRLQFLVVFVGFVVALPIALSGLNLVYARSTVAVGFSGVIMAFVGYLAFALGDYLGSWLGVPVDRRRSRWLFFLGLALVALLTAPPPYGIVLAGTAVVSALLCLVPILRDLVGNGGPTGSAVGQAGTLELGGLGIAIFGVFPFVAFPSDVTIAAGTVNLYTHLLGFCLGYVVTYSTLIVGGLDVD